VHCFFVCVDGDVDDAVVIEQRKRFDSAIHEGFAKSHAEGWWCGEGRWFCWDQVDSFVGGGELQIKVMGVPWSAELEHEFIV
jgi:hypothetical protein